MSAHGNSPAHERNSSTGFDTISQEPSRRNLGSLGFHKELSPSTTMSTRSTSPAHERTTRSRSEVENGETSSAGNIVIPTIELSPAQQQMFDALWSDFYAPQLNIGTDQAPTMVRADDN
jgi:hypothetical protein